MATRVKAYTKRGFYGTEYAQATWNEKHPRDIKKDKERKAIKPGYRKAKTTGKTYFENRKNRSDKKPARRL